MKLRPYQNDCLEKVKDGFREYRKLLTVVPTGGGKTVIFSHLAAQAHGRVLICAHREELIQQAKEKLERATGIVAEIERADDCASLSARVVVASVQTLCRRYQKFPANHFSIVIVDEAHHTIADSYQGFLGYFLEGGAKVLGVTATPNTKGKKALGNFYEDIAFEIGLLDLIRAGYLASIRLKAFPLRADLNAAALELSRKVISRDGDYDQNVVAHALEPYLEDIVRRLPEQIGDRKTLVFLPLVATVHKFVDLCRKNGLTAAAISGESEDREQILKAHGREFQILANSMLLTEGYDDPEIGALLCLRLTRSEILFSQMVGRGTRIFCPWGCTERCTHAARKKELVLLDPLWLHEDLNIVRPAMLVTGNEEERKTISERTTEDCDEGQDLLELLSQAEHERESALAKKLAKLERRRSSTVSVEEWALMTHRPSLAEFEPTMGWHTMPPSDKQLALLGKLGFDTQSIKSRGQAKVLLDSFFGRKAKGLASVRQVRSLKQMGHPSPDTATFEQAKAFLDEKWGKKPKPKHIPANV